MGFLMGAYGKLMAGQRARSIQFRLTTIQSQLRRVTRDIGDREKMYAAQERNMKNQMQSQIMGVAYGYMGVDPYTAQMGMSNPQLWGNISQSMDMNKYAACMQAAQMQCSAAQTLWQDVFEMNKNADLQALKDLEEDLQIEKDNLESQLKIATQDYEANKEMEKQGAQNLKPDYTGQS